MEGHFAAFSFVDKIDTVTPGRSIEGRYFVPGNLPHFRHALCCEAVGQCAAWSAMAALDFQFRPVAGISSSVEFFDEVKPGETLILTAELSRSDSEAVTYNGWATAGGRRIVQLNECLGPMLPMEHFDDPEAVRARCRRLTGPGAESGLFPGVPEFSATVTSRDETSLEGFFRVPDTAGFFADHFPRKPVFPGTLFLDLCVRFASQLAGAGLRPAGARDTKLREFMEPGAELSLRAERSDGEDGGCWVDVLQTGGKRAKRLVKIPFARK